MIRSTGFGNRCEFSDQAVRDEECNYLYYIFMDPPYKKGFEEEVLSIIDRSSICTEDTVVIVESSLDTEIPDFEKLKVIRVKEYKTNKHTFLMKTVED